MSRSLAEIEREHKLRQDHAESIKRLHDGGLTAGQAQLEIERLQDINHELADLAAKDAPPPLPPAVAGIEKVTPEEARKKAADIRANPQYWDPSKPDANGAHHGRTCRAGPGAQRIPCPRGRG